MQLKSKDLDFYHIPLDNANTSTPDIWSESDVSKLMQVIGQELEREEGQTYGEKDS